MRKYFKMSDIQRYRTPIDRLCREIRMLGTDEIKSHVATYNKSILDEVEIFAQSNGETYSHKDGTVTVSLDAITEYGYQGKFKEIYVYICSSFITKGRGFMYRKHLLECLAVLTGVKYKPLLEIEKFLLEEGLWEYDRRLDTITVLSKNKLPHKVGSKNKKSVQIPFLYLTDYNKFKEHYICISHLKVQNTFLWALPKIKNNRNCPLLRQRIDFDGEPTEKKVGCAIRKLAEKIPFSYSTIQKSLKGYTNRVYNEVERLTKIEFQKKYNMKFFVLNPKYSFKVTRKEGISVYSIRYALGSKNDYIFQSCLKNRFVIPLRNKSRSNITSTVALLIDYPY